MVLYLILFQLHAVSTVKMNESKPRLYNLASFICAYKFNLICVLFFDQVELWFPSERDLPVPGDPAEPLPYDRLANLKKVMQQVKRFF